MAKVKTHYSCQTCGTSSAKWLGRCPGCGEWGSMVEEKDAGQDFQTARDAAFEVVGAKPYVKLDEVESNGPMRRISTGISELDRVLGGGLIPDSFVLVGGDPGIGKSTLLLQMARGLANEHKDLKILYVSGEESVDQI